MDIEDVPEDQNKGEKKHYHDDHFRGHHDDILPKTFNDNPEVEDLLKKRAFSQEEEIKKVRALVGNTIKGEIHEKKEQTMKEIEKVIHEYYKMVANLREQAKLLPKSQEYKKFIETLPKSIGEFEKTMKGSLLRLWHLFAFGTESGWWKKADDMLAVQWKKAREKFKIATDEQEAWLAPQIVELERKKEETISKLFNRFTSAIESNNFDTMISEEIEKQTKAQESLRNPKDSQAN